MAEGLSLAQALLDAYCEAPDWSAAADVLATHGAILLGPEVARAADRLAERLRGREFERTSTRLAVLARCREAAPGDVLLELVASDRLGPYGPTIGSVIKEAGQRDAVLAACTAALAAGASEPDTPTWAYVLFQRAHALIRFAPTQAGVRQAVNDLLAAERVLTRADYPEHWRRLRHTLGDAWRRADSGDRTADLERAIASLEAVLDAAGTERTPAAANSMNSLGDAYSRRLIGDRAENLTRADHLLHSAYDAFGELRRVRERAAAARNLSGLAIRRLDRPPHRRLADACRWAQRAEDLFATLGDNSEVCRTRADLGSAFAQFALAEHVPALFRHAIDLIESGGSQWGDIDPSDYAGARMNLGASIAALATTDAERVRAVTHFAEALAYVDDSDPGRRMGVLTNRGLTLLQLHNWEAAAADLRAAADMSDVALLRSEIEENERHVVGQIDEAYSAGAYGLVQLGRHDDALRLIERGRARMLNRQLAASRPEAVADAEWSVSNSALVSIAVSTAGTVAFVLPPGTSYVRDEHVVRLPQLTGSRLRELTVGTRAGTIGWLMRAIMIDFAQSDNEYQDSVEAFVGGIEDAMTWLTAEVMAPVAERLDALGVGAGVPVVLSTDGELATTPLHATALHDGAFWERHPVSYSPSLAVASLARRRAAPTGPPATVLAVSDESGTLPFAPVEIACLEARLPAGAVHRLEPTESFVQACRSSELVHLACHGVHDWGTVSGSYLDVHKHEHLTADTIAGLDLRGCRLVFLSACESGLTHFIQLRNEFLGLPAAFLRAGAEAVICSLWRVDDLASALLADRFYDFYLCGQRPSAALQRASLWLRDVTSDELCADIAWLPTDTRAALAGLGSGSRPFAAPFYWAPFVVVGG